MRKLLSCMVIILVMLAVPLSSRAILKPVSWKVTLTTAGVAQSIFNPALPDVLYVPAFRVFNLSTLGGGNMIYVGGDDVTATNAEPVGPGQGIEFSNEQTYGQIARMFDLQAAYFDADADGTEIIVTVMYDDGN